MMITIDLRLAVAPMLNGRYLSFFAKDDIFRKVSYLRYLAVNFDIEFYYIEQTTQSVDEVTQLLTDTKNQGLFLKQQVETYFMPFL